MAFMLNIKTAEERQAEILAAIKAKITSAVDAYVEAKAVELGYNSAANIATYVNSTVPKWAAEAKAFVAWRDAVWQVVFNKLKEAEKNNVQLDVDEVMSALPPYKT
jgi:hypothetical protein